MNLKQLGLCQWDQGKGQYFHDYKDFKQLGLCQYDQDKGMILVTYLF
jgi:hypothetical protein